MSRLLIALVLLTVVGAPQDIDPALKMAVERFFATQAAEDADGYMALWSRTSKRPDPAQLKYIFDYGDDKFSDLEITRAVVDGDTARVRGSITRVRSSTNPQNPAAIPPRPFTSRNVFALTYVREDGEWKLVREGSPGDELADSLIKEPDAAARAALMQADADLLTQRLVDALGRRADPYARAGQYKAAQEIYERAVEAAVAMKNRKAEGEMLQNVANSLYYQKNFHAALGTYEKRLALEREAANETGIASALIGVATIKYATYEYSEALKLYLEALALQEKLDDEALVATTLVSTGNVRYLQGDFDAAIADYRRAEALKRQYHDLAGAAMALEGLGRTYAAQGDYASAFVAFASLLEDAARRKDVRRQGSALSSVGDVHARLANLDAARTAYDDSRKAYESVKELADAGRALHAIGLVELMSGRPPQAEAAYEKSQAYCSSAVPQDSECIARALIGLGFAQASQERWDPAIANYRKGIDVLMMMQAYEAGGRARVGLAEALIGKGEYAAAMKEAGESRDVAVGLGADDLLWRALVSVSRAQRKLKRPDDALGTARAAVVAVRGIAEAAAKRPGHATPRDVTIAYANVAILHAEAGNAAAAWDVIEEMRVRALRNALAAHERDISPGMTDEERAAERTIAAELTVLLAQRDRERTMAKPEEARLKRLEASIGPATEKRAAFLQQLFARLPELPLWRGLAPAATVEETAAANLLEGQIVVQFVVDDQELLVLTARRTGDAVERAAHVVPVKRQVLAERVARAVDAANLADLELWRKASLEIVQSLPPVVFEQMSSAPHVLVIPDDMLWRLPFEALPVGAQYLADQARVTYAASMTSVVRTPKRGDAPPFRMAIVAAPAVPVAVVETLKSTAPTWTLRAADAARAQAEKIAAVAGAEQSSTVTGDAATEETVRATAAAAAVLHVEGPFRVNAASPLFSSLLLVPPPASETVAPPEANGVLEAREVPAAGFAARVAVFADPAALSMRDSAAATPALHWAWRAGGTEAVLLRRWPGDEAVSGELLTAFYAAIKDGASAADALYVAQAAVRRKPEGMAAPAAWAGWLLLKAP